MVFTEQEKNSGGGYLETTMNYKQKKMMLSLDSLTAMLHYRSKWSINFKIVNDKNVDQGVNIS